ncbi:hypothetical protein JCM11251_005423 [Rhodosporidiobolus azoricus]
MLFPASPDREQMESDDDLHAGTSDGGGKNGAGIAKKGKTKGTKEADRKAQNRIAQREFRQRKQQYVKELEAKVAMYEMGRDEQLERMVNALQMLLEENQQLRTLLTQLSGFIGEGIGSCLPRIGLEVPEFKEILNRTLFDNAADALKLPIGSKATGGSSSRAAAPTPAPPVPSTSARTLDSLPQPSTPQLSRPAYHNHFPPSNSSSQLPFPSAAPVSAPLPVPCLIPQTDYSQFALSSAPQSIASNPFEGYSQTYATFAQPPPPPRPSSPARPPPQPVSQPQGQPPRRQSSGASSTTSATAGKTVALESVEEENAQFIKTLQKGDLEEVTTRVRSLAGMPSDETQMQAIQLIGYHMRNKHDNPNYHLPPSLRMSAVQQTVPHHPFFDGIIFSSMRDRLILLKDQYSVDELIQDFTVAIQIHGDDLLSPDAWELSETFLKKYWYVIDQEVLDISNRWRSERGEAPLSMRCIVPSKDATDSNSRTSSGEGATPEGQMDGLDGESAAARTRAGQMMFPLGDF